MNQKAVDLIKEIVDAAFECGDWRMGDRPPYEDPLKRKLEAVAALEQYIEALERKAAGRIE